jgi:acetyl-CoA synthetase
LAEEIYVSITIESETAAKPSYREAYDHFSLDELLARFQGSFSAGINACVECCDRHPADNIALEWENQAGDRASYTFGQLKKLSGQFANFLAAQSIGPGDVVGGLLPRIPELVVTILGTWRAGAVYQPFFTAFGPSAIAHRLKTSRAKLIVTDSANRPKLDEIPDAPSAAIVLPKGQSLPLKPGDFDFHAELGRQNEYFEPVLLTSEKLFMLMSTSGTTGLPKGVPVPLKALLSFHVYMTDAVDLRAADRFWNIADPGWAYGLYYAVTGPLLLGHATTLYDGPFTAESTFRLIKSQNITSLAGSPTAFRLLMAAGADAAENIKHQLRTVSSAGEPLNPEVIRWFDKNLGAPIHDHYGQTELGMVVNNHHGLAHEVHPGAAGFAMRGYRMVVLSEDGTEVPPLTPGTLAVDIKNSPLMWFTGYLNQPTPAISGGYYRTGDTVELAQDGYISFIGRNDDVITSSGYRIGPFDVESALIEHPAVIEAAVIGKPDAERTEIVKAHVVLHASFSPTEALAEELRQFVKHRLSAHAYPREIVFTEQLPKTPSGKIQRFILRNLEKDESK